eukprot:TRINITY_DN11316_c0_g2_i2.p2 TRINITY_DN11316_c0_g2~~TRINITY_DN11316_c0_g2_i2.p2  ORF type:complete len:304 (+),score=74.61 TRINITY_DN11316_c0_g2_i2:2452-3363(+)
MTAVMALSKCIKLNTGAQMPRLAFGTGTQWFKNKDGVSNQNGAASLADQLHAALDAGYSHIDAAEMYETEQFTGPAFQDYLKQRGKQRGDYFITGKVLRSAPDVATAVDKTLNYFGTDYLDLYLVHAPFLKEKGIEASLKGVWQQMEQLVDNGKIKAIGVSNFAVSHLEELATFQRIPPSVNQIECHAQLWQPELEDYCKNNSIVVTAYSSLKPLAALADHQQLDQVVSDIASKHNRTNADVLLAWNLRRDIGVITTSSKPARLSAALDCLDLQLTDDEVKAIGKAGQDARKRYFWTDEFGNE